MRLTTCQFQQISRHRNTELLLLFSIISSCQDLEYRLDITILDRSNSVLLPLYEKIWQGQSPSLHVALKAVTYLTAHFGVSNQRHILPFKVIRANEYLLQKLTFLMIAPRQKFLNFSTAGNKKKLKTFVYLGVCNNKRCFVSVYSSYFDNNG